MKTKGRQLAVTTGLGAFVIIALTAWLAWPRIKFAYLFESLGHQRPSRLDSFSLNFSPEEKNPG